MDELEKQNKDMLMRIFDVQDELNPSECEITLPEKINDLKGQINDLKGIGRKTGEANRKYGVLLCEFG